MFIINNPNSLVAIGSFDFEKCSSLKEIMIPCFTKLGKNAFAKCKSLKEMVLSNFLTKISESLFEEWTLITHITIPQSATQIESNAFLFMSYALYIGSWVFSDCTLEQIKFPPHLINAGYY